MSFGQAAFFGLGGYAYAIAAINIGDSTGPCSSPCAVPTLFAAAARLLHVLRPDQRRLYRRHHPDGVADPVQVHELHRRQRIPRSARPARRLQRHPGDRRPSTARRPRQTSSTPRHLVRRHGQPVVVYVLLRAILASRSAAWSWRSARTRPGPQLLGYDPRLYKLLAFIISAGDGGPRRLPLRQLGRLRQPDVFGLTMSAQIIICVLVGGLGTLLGPILGAVLIQWLTIEAGAQNVIDSNLGLGVDPRHLRAADPAGAGAGGPQPRPAPRHGLGGRRMRAKPVGPAPGTALAGRSADERAPRRCPLRPLLETTGAHHALRRRHRRQRRRLHPRRGRAALPDRPERRRQEHLLQAADRPAHGRPPDASISAAADSPAAHPHEIARLGVGIKTQVPNVFNGLSVRENVWIVARRAQEVARPQPRQSSTRC